jgi:catalase
MTPEQTKALTYDAFDDSKIWENVPEIKVGTMTLNKVPDNFFEYTEESAFAPSDLIPGVEASPDRMLQGRLFAYADTQRYRIGANYNQLPVNRPLATVSNDYQDGVMQAGGRKGDVNYEPSVTRPTPAEDPKFKLADYDVTGTTRTRAISKTENFRQAGEFYRSLDKMAQDHLVKNLASDLGRVTNEKIRAMMTAHFYQADKDFGTHLAKAVNVSVADVEREVAAQQAAAASLIASAK